MSSWWLASWRGKQQKSCIEVSQNPLPPLIPQKENLEKDDMQDNTGVLSSALNFDFDPLRLEYEDPSNLHEDVFLWYLSVLRLIKLLPQVFQTWGFSMFSKIAPQKKRIIGCLQTFWTQLVEFIRSWGYLNLWEYGWFGVIPCNSYYFQ